MAVPYWPDEPDAYEVLRAVEEAAARAGFTVLEASLSHGVPTLLVQPRRDVKRAFEDLMELLMPLRIMPVLRRGPHGLVIRAVPMRAVKKGSSRVPLILFLATLGTLFATGWLLSADLPEGPLVGALMYVGAMMAILATHELGHWIAARLHGVTVTMPYFIPAPPPISIFGTFGAFIQQKTPAPNKDALFDIGVAGPLAGFVAAVAITLIGLPLSKIVIGPVRGITLPYIPAYALLARLVLGPLHSIAGEEVHITLHPIAFAGWTGMLVTMLNLIPAGSLDGGHIARCFLGPREQKILGVSASLFIVFLSIAFPGLYGAWYMPMAFLALLMALSYRHPGPLDDVSSLSAWRKALALVPAVIFVLCLFPIPVP